jgi:hypothetical protein
MQDRKMMTPELVIQTREMMLRQGVNDINLMCTHLWSGQSSRPSALRMFGVRLCDQCARDIADGIDPTPHCTRCGAKKASSCKCPPDAENN